VLQQEEKLPFIHVDRVVVAEAQVEVDGSAERLLLRQSLLQFLKKRDVPLATKII